MTFIRDIFYILFVFKGRYEKDKLTSAVMFYVFSEVLIMTSPGICLIIVLCGNNDYFTKC